MTARIPTSDNMATTSPDVPEICSGPSSNTQASIPSETDNESAAEGDSLRNMILVRAHSIAEHANARIATGLRPFITTASLTGALLAAIVIGCGLYSSLDSSFLRLQEDFNESQSLLDKSNADKLELQSEIDTLRSELSEAEGDRDSYKLQLEELEDQQATIVDMTAKLEELQGQYDSLLEERDSLQGQVDAKKLAEEQAQREQEQNRLNQTSSGYGRTVYWVPGGSVYHLSPNCPTLKRSNDIRSGSISSSGKPRCCKVCG